ncbi:MAG: type VI secretion system tube protein TssD [bacterium]|nr:type VI secretion system tube protein TssD [bacterium]
MRLWSKYSLIALLTVISSSAGIAGEWHASVTGKSQGKFPGAAKGSPHAGKIPVLTFDYELKAPRDIATGQTTGKRQHKPIRIIKEWDATTPMFLTGIVNGETLTEVVLEYWEEDDSGEKVMTFKITLTDCLVTTAAQGDPVHGVDVKLGAKMQEIIEMTYSTLDFEHLQSKKTIRDAWPTGR